MACLSKRYNDEKRRVFFKNIFMALDSKGPGCVNVLSPRVGKLSPTASIHPGL